MSPTRIAWTDETWNPTVGCSPVSPGCENCWAARQAHRGLTASHRGLTLPVRMPPRWNNKVRMLPERLDQPLRWRKPRRVAVSLMGDLFHEAIPDDYIAKAWQVMSTCPQHTFQILTKRPERMHSWMGRWYTGKIAEPYDVRPIHGFPGYEITTRGQVLGRRSDTRDGLSPDAGESGHLRVTMYRAESSRNGERELVHRLVLTAFVRPSRPNEQACHRNGDPSDNRLSNLYWGTQEDNWRDRKIHGNRRSYTKLSLADVEAIRGRNVEGQSVESIATDFGVSDTQVRNILNGKQWKPSEARPLIKFPGRPVLEQVWLGTSAEDQKTLDERVPYLLQTPAAVRFLSLEPLLGPVDLHTVPWQHGGMAAKGWTGVLPVADEPDDYVYWEQKQALQWVIVGGESGPGARGCDIGRIRSVIEQCKAAGVACFVKQLGSHPYEAHGEMDYCCSQCEEHPGKHPLDYEGSDGICRPLRDPRGADPAEWPADLRVQEFPE